MNLEGQDEVGDGGYRKISKGATEGLKRGLTSERTNVPISGAVRPETRGRM